eukprot:764518-Hanusia_phi.AAC.2
MVDKRAALAAVGVGVTMMALVLLASSSDDALALLSSHHRHAEHHLEKALLLERNIARKDASSLRELSQLAAAADKQASSAKKLRDVETKKLMISSGSKVDAENMLANEAIKKSREIKDQVSDAAASVVAFLRFKSPLICTMTAFVSSLVLPPSFSSPLCPFLPQWLPCLDLAEVALLLRST